MYQPVIHRRPKIARDRAIFRAIARRDDSPLVAERPIGDAPLWCGGEISGRRNGTGAGIDEVFRGIVVLMRLLARASMPSSFRS
ncbi:MAG: hypothetical protein ACREBD_05645 [Blastocatellia bacterium]